MQFPQSVCREMSQFFSYNAVCLKIGERESLESFSFTAAFKESASQSKGFCVICRRRLFPSISAFRAQLSSRLIAFPLKFKLVIVKFNCIAESNCSAS